MSDWPAIAELLPHAGPMRLLDRVAAHSALETSCELDAAGSALLADDDGTVPSWVALEWMAQCAAAHGALLARAAGAPALQGMLVGARRVTLARASFSPEVRLRVSARPTGRAGELVTFECELRASPRDEPLASASISVVVGNFAPAA